MGENQNPQLAQIETSILNSVLSYLAQQPYQEVAGLISEINTAKLVPAQEPEPNE